MTQRPEIALTPELRAEIESWIAIDDEHGDGLRRMLAHDEHRELLALFGGRLDFGTAGLRGPMRPGPLGMNSLVVAQTTAGLFDWLTQQGIETPRVVIGFDARHRSARYAGDAATVLSDRGAQVMLVDQPSPTPVLALAVLDESADAGIMITASHNPAADNGYKLYLGDGLQIVPPADSEIAAAIGAWQWSNPMRDAIPPSTTATSATLMTPSSPSPPGGSVVDIGDRATSRHQVAAGQALLTNYRDISVVYTAMHGVGGHHFLRCMNEAGFPEPTIVEEQFSPDPDFPTTEFPNPEEPGALDLALAKAAEVGAELVIAHDPDADRLSVAELDTDGVWRRLSGDEVGVLLADHVLRHTDRAEGDLISSSVVSSRWIEALADMHSVSSVRTLTGFKWVARPIVDRPSDRFLLGYEEALGYCIGSRVRDKDGISAALVVAELAAECKANSSSLRHRLDQLAEQLGLFMTRQVSVRFDSGHPGAREAEIARILALEPTELAGVKVRSRQDLSTGLDLPPTTGVIWDLADRSRVIIRPSGTEPKVKAYLEIIERPVPSGGAGQARAQASRRLDDLATAVELLLS